MPYMACGMICVHGVSKRFGRGEGRRRGGHLRRARRVRRAARAERLRQDDAAPADRGLRAPDAGEIEIEERPVAGDGAWVPPERRRVGMVFQDYALFPHLTVAENVGFGCPAPAPGPRRASCSSSSASAGFGRPLPARALRRPAAARRARTRARARPAIVLLDEP